MWVSLNDLHDKRLELISQYISLIHRLIKKGAAINLGSHDGGCYVTASSKKTPKKHKKAVMCRGSLVQEVLDL